MTALAHEPARIMDHRETMGALFDAARELVANGTRGAAAYASTIIASFKTSAGMMKDIEHAANELGAQFSEDALLTHANETRTYSLWQSFFKAQKRAGKMMGKVLNFRPSELRKKPTQPTLNKDN